MPCHASQGWVLSKCIHTGGDGRKEGGCIHCTTDFIHECTHCEDCEPPVSVSAFLPPPPQQLLRSCRCFFPRVVPLSDRVNVPSASSSCASMSASQHSSPPPPPFFLLCCGLDDMQRCESTEDLSWGVILCRVCVHISKVKTSRLLWRQKCRIFPIFLQMWKFLNKELTQQEPE